MIQLLYYTMSRTRISTKITLFFTLKHMRCAGTVWKEQFNLNLLALLYPVRDG